MLRLRYLAYLAIVCAVLLDLSSGYPNASAVLRTSLDGAALVLAVIGFGGLALSSRASRRF